MYLAAFIQHTATEDSPCESRDSGGLEGGCREPEIGLVADRHKRLAQLQQPCKRNPHYQTLERDLIELQEQQLFELFVVVSLQKTASGTNYVPQVTQQFPSKVGANPRPDGCCLLLTATVVAARFTNVEQVLTQVLPEWAVLLLQLPRRWEPPSPACLSPRSGLWLCAPPLGPLELWAA